MLTLRELKRNIEFRAAYGELPVTYMDHDARHFSGSYPASQIARKLPPTKEQNTTANDNKRYVEISYDPERQELICCPVL